MNTVAYKIWTSEAIAASSTATSAAIPVGKASTMALHVTSFTGTGPDVTFGYSLSNSADGTFVVPVAPVTILANAAAADVLDFTPETAQYIKITALNNSAPEYNGELRKLYNDLKRELDVLGATYDERWNAHDKRSDRLNQKFDNMHTDIDAIKVLINDKFATLNCAVHTERMGN